MYHMPHNTARADEVLFLINSLNSNNKQFLFQDIVKILLQEEITKGVFSNFHNKPYLQFTQNQPPDKDKIRKQLDEIYKSKTRKNGMPLGLYNFLIINGAEKTCSYIITKRIENFRKFLKQPSKYINLLLETQYSITKTWKQIWVEYVRDIVDFCAYIGVLPCYSKQPNLSYEFEGYYVSDKLKEIQSDNNNFEKIIFDFKYSNSSINTRRFTQFNIRVRPFYIVLKLLSELKRKNVLSIERRELFYTVASISTEDDLNTIIEDIVKSFETQKKTSNLKKIDERMLKEGGRVATGMQDFLIKYGFVSIEKKDLCHFFKITNKGESILNQIPKNSLYYAQTEERTNLVYSPLVASLLDTLKENSLQNITELNLQSIYNSYQNVENETILYCLENIKDFKTSPIKELSKTIVILNDWDHQYHITPFVDFNSIDEINFIRTRKSRIGISVSEKSIPLPPQEIVNEVLIAAHSSDGTRYEKAIYQAIAKLPGKVVHLGQAQTGSRLSDILWTVDLSVDGEKRSIAVIFEAKSGNAISQFDERKEIDNIRNTIVYNKQTFKNIDGLWIIVVNSDKIPSIDKHGGARNDNLQRSFLDKLFQIHIKLQQDFGLPILVTAFGVDPFIEYYKYLYGCSEGKQTNKINPFTEHFFMKGNLFFDEYRYIKVLRNADEIKPKLFI
jgi:hypothetical protein